MRLQVIVVLLVVLSIVTLAHADGRVGAWISHHASSDGLTVVSPRATLTVPVHHGWDVLGGVEADVITGASIDVLTSASPRGYTEVRRGGHVGVAWKPRADTTISARAIGSTENDYLGRAFVLGGEREWLERRLLTSLGVRGSFDAVGRAGEPREQWRALDTLAVDAGVAWVFSRRTVGQLTIEGQRSSGFLSSPYRFVRIAWPGVPLESGVPEQTPDDRVRFAVGVGARHAVFEGWFVSTTLRLYRDSWAITSHTEEVELQRALFDDRLILGVAGRLYGQTAASFYRARYTATDAELPRLRTADKMLAPMSTVLGAVRASLGLGSLGPLRALRLTAKLEWYEQRFFEFLPLTSRSAVVTSLGLTTEL